MMEELFKSVLEINIA